jgi:hypothetical protein
MSNAIFPAASATPGLGWSVVKKPSFNTKKQTSVGNIEQRASFTPYPAVDVDPQVQRAPPRRAL